MMNGEFTCRTIHFASLCFFFYFFQNRHDVVKQTNGLRSTSLCLNKSKEKFPFHHVNKYWQNSVEMLAREK